MTHDDATSAKHERIIAKLAAGFRQQAIVESERCSRATVTRVARDHREEIERRARASAQALKKAFVSNSFKGLEALARHIDSPPDPDEPAPDLTAAKALAGFGLRIVELAEKSGDLTISGSPPPGRLRITLGAPEDEGDDADD